MPIQIDDHNGKFWDEPLNPIVHRNCNADCELGDHCWATAGQKRLKRLPSGVIWKPEVLKKASVRGDAKVFFVCNTCDIAHESVDPLYVQTIFRDMDITTVFRKEHELKSHTYLIFTRHPDNLWKMCDPIIKDENLTERANIYIYIGISVVNQETFDKRIGGLLKFAEAGFKTIVSYEPALGPINLFKAISGWKTNPLSDDKAVRTMKVNQVIAGCETGTGARPADPDWFRSVRSQCKAAGVPFFLKKLNKGGRILDGVRHDEWRK